MGPINLAEKSVSKLNYFMSPGTTQTPAVRRCERVFTVSMSNCRGCVVRNTDTPVRRQSHDLHHRDQRRRKGRRCYFVCDGASAADFTSTATVFTARTAGSGAVHVRKCLKDRQSPLPRVGLLCFVCIGHTRRNSTGNHRRRCQALQALSPHHKNRK